MGLLRFGANMLRVAAVGCGSVLSFCAWTQADPDFVGTVTSVLDGDTIRVVLNSGPVTVRLGNIDAPESIQPGGGAATRALDARILGEKVSLHAVKHDGDQRLVAIVYLGGDNINAWMVKQGHAWAYRGFTEDSNYCVWENAARSLRRGLWREQDWIAPWDWRMSRRDALYFASDYSNTSTASCMREIREAVAFDE